MNNWAPVQFIEAFVDLTAPVTKTTFDKQQFFKVISLDEEIIKQTGNIGSFVKENSWGKFRDIETEKLIPRKMKAFFFLC